MISKTGNFRAFTFIEVMAAVSVLSLGLVMIYQVFFTSLNYINYVSNHLYAILEANNKIWEMDDTFNRSEGACDFPASGQLKFDGVLFVWRNTSVLLDGTASLYRIGIDLSWIDKGKNDSLARVAYVGK